MERSLAFRAVRIAVTIPARGTTDADHLLSADRSVQHDLRFRARQPVAAPDCWSDHLRRVLVPCCMGVLTMTALSFRQNGDRLEAFQVDGEPAGFIEPGSP